VAFFYLKTPILILLILVTYKYCTTTNNNTHFTTIVKQGNKALGEIPEDFERK
jgi:hypothetical protein